MIPCRSGPQSTKRPLRRRACREPVLSLRIRASFSGVSAIPVSSTDFAFSFPSSHSTNTQPRLFPDSAQTGPSEGVRLLVTGARGPGGFPPPVTDPRGRYRLWRWSDVERWLAASLGEETATVEDHALAAINASLELRHHEH